MLLYFVINFKQALKYLFFYIQILILPSPIAKVDWLFTYICAMDKRF